jgi:hypothetical protein
VALEEGDDPPRHFVDLLAAMVELEVGNRARRAADRLAVHANDVADQRAGGREGAHNIVALVIKLGAVEGDEADVVGACVEAELAEPGAVERVPDLRCHLGWRRASLLEADHGRVGREVLAHRGMSSYTRASRSEHGPIQ